MPTKSKETTIQELASAARAFIKYVEEYSDPCDESYDHLKKVLKNVPKLPR